MATSVFSAYCLMASFPLTAETVFYRAFSESFPGKSGLHRRRQQPALLLQQTLNQARVFHEPGSTGCIQREGKRYFSPPLLLRIECNGPSHQFNQTFGNGKPQSAPFVPRIFRESSCTKWLNTFFCISVSIPFRYRSQKIRWFPARPATESNLSVAGEFYGIVENVSKNFNQQFRIGIEINLPAVFHLVTEPNLFGSTGFKRFAQFAEQNGTETCFMSAHVSGSNEGDVHEIGDGIDQAVAALPENIEIGIFLIIRQTRLCQQFAKPQDTIQRGAYFV